MKFRIIRVDEVDGVSKKYPCVKLFGYEKEADSLEYVNVESLDELMRLVDALDYCVIIYTDDRDGTPRTLEIYDDHIE